VRFGKKGKRKRNTSPNRGRFGERKEAYKRKIKVFTKVGGKKGAREKIQRGGGDGGGAKAIAWVSKTQHPFILGGEEGKPSSSRTITEEERISAKKGRTETGVPRERRGELQRTQLPQR